MRTKIRSPHSTALVTMPGRLPGPAAAPSHGPLGRIVVISLTAGAVAASALTFGLLGGATESAITGSALVAFGANWAMLAVLSTRLTSQPQRWALVPAAVMTAMGLVLLASAPDEAGLAVMGRMWPPVMLVLAGWMSGSWARIIPAVARTTPVCAYDRAGQGWSEEAASCLRLSDAPGDY
jgi:hypothetical protein